MSQPEKVRGASRRYRLLLAWAIVILVGVALYTYRLTSSPAGFFIDESSIAYNAYTISQTGQDEFGNSWPLYFRAFGDYKNPVQIYLLAALFKLTGPSILTARLLGAIAGVATALLLGLLATRVSHRRGVGLLVAASALLTPWLFELSRVAFEVALYPLAVTLFLLSVHNVSTKAKWKWFDVISVVSTLVLLTYTYSIGRLLAPLLALGLVVFATYSHWPGILRTWGLYLLTLLPMVVFQQRHTDALTGRFRMISYINPEASIAATGSSFIKHYLANLNPVRLLITGDPDVYQVAHVPGIPAFLAATVVVVIVGAWLVLRRHLHDAWWRFILYGLLVAVLPASLTFNYFHILRLSPLPVFLIVLMIPGFDWLLKKSAPSYRVVLTLLLILTVGQAAIVQYKFHASARSPQRLHLFDAEYPAKILPAALSAAAGRSIYIADRVAPGYIQAYWYATLLGIPSERFVILGPLETIPENAVAITTDARGPRCRILSQSETYTVCAITGSAHPPVRLPDSEFRAEIMVVDPPTNLKAGAKATLRIEMKNLGDAVWLARERGMSPFQLSVGNHWLDAEGRIVIHDDGRSPLVRDLRPGEATETSMDVNAPTQPGDYQLEIDMLQEGVSWFGERGSKTWRGRIIVN